MEIKQQLSLRRLLAPELSQSLKILAMALPDLKSLLEEELLSNPLLEESPVVSPAKTSLPSIESLRKTSISSETMDYRMSLIGNKVSLQDILMRQLGMFANTKEEFEIGQAIIGNIDGNGYLQATLEEISARLGVSFDAAMKALKIVQQFEPAGVAARNIAECLIIQLDAKNDPDPLARKIIGSYLDLVAKKNYTLLAKKLSGSVDNVRLAVSKILKLDPKPGRNYASEDIQRVVPDVTIEENSDDEDGEFNITVNDEDMPTVHINKAYRLMLKSNNLTPEAKEFLFSKLDNALNLLRSVTRRKFTLRKIVEEIARIQKEAITGDLSMLKPLTFNEVALRIGIHESTVCRAIMGKYVKLPYGVVSLKAFFPSHVYDKDGQTVSCDCIKKLIAGMISKEDKKNPLSDQAICMILSKENNFKVSRRTVGKYREELKILSSCYRRER